MKNNLKNMRILVTPTTYGQNDPMLRTFLEEQVREAIYNPMARPLAAVELVELIPSIDGYIAGLDEINAGVIKAADKLKVIARYGVGVDNVDLEAARARGIVVTNTPGANSASVAELTVALILALARNIPQAVWAAKDGEWPRISGISLEGKVVGLIGYGAIGEQVARRLVNFDCTILAFDPAVDAARVEQAGVRLVDREEVISRSDFLSLHAPLLDETRCMVNTEFLAKMKRGAYLINTARGELVDEGALLAALQSGYLRGAALDVFTQQPPEADHPLLALPQVIATPHMGAHSDAATNAMGWAALRDCLAVLRGKEAVYRVV